MSNEQTEMAGDYEVIQSLLIGGKSLLIGYNPNDKDGKYMTCFKESSALGVLYTKAMASDDYLEIVHLFTERLQEQIKKVEQFRAQRSVPLETLGKEHCRARGEGESLVGKLIILRPTSLAPEYRTADCQLGYAMGGFGCSPNTRGKAMKAVASPAAAFALSQEEIDYIRTRAIMEIDGEDVEVSFDVDGHPICEEEATPPAPVDRGDEMLQQALLAAELSIRERHPWEYRRLRRSLFGVAVNLPGRAGRQLDAAVYRAANRVFRFN